MLRIAFHLLIAFLCSVAVNAQAPLRFRAGSGEAASATGAAGIYDVGVVPGQPGDCGGNQYVWIYMDTRDNSDDDYVRGWTGAISQSSTGTGITLGFCRVSGALLNHLQMPTGADSTWYGYAVLKLGTTCPNLSREFSRYIDNEDHNNQNGYSGDVAPNEVTRNTHLKFCLFVPNATPYMPSFPNLGFQYGVFVAETTPGMKDKNYWLQTGVVQATSERFNPRDETYVDGLASGEALLATSIVRGTKGSTTFTVAEVRRPMPCNAALLNPNGQVIVGLVASYDGANCHVGPAPTGAFTAGQGFYVPALRTCPEGQLSGLACRIMVMPQNGFVADNKLYVHRTGVFCPQNTTPEPGRCLVRSAPPGTQAFVSHHMTVRYFAIRPTLSCLQGVLDGGNCLLMRVAAPAKPFIHVGKYYYMQ